MFKKFKKTEENSNYRKVGLETNLSNYGWYKCVHCGKSFRKGDIDIDHIVPKSKGGTNDASNLQCLCVHCNRSKGNKIDNTKKDLKMRKRSLAQYKRSQILKAMIAKETREIEELLKKFSDEEICSMLDDSEFKDLIGVKKEARRRKII